MNIKLSPQRTDKVLTVSKQGDVLTFNDIPYDFSSIPEWGTLPKEAHDCEWIQGDIERVGLELELTIILPHGPNPPQEVAFPEPILNAEDGVLI